MRTDMPAEIWLDPHRWEALQEVLEQDGTSIQNLLQDYLIEVYTDRVPIEQQKEIDRRIEAERLEAAQAAESRRVFSAMRIREHGMEHILQEENGREFLQLAALLRRYLRDEFTNLPREFVQIFDHAEEITEKRFYELANIRRENTGKVSGVFEINLDNGLLSCLHITDGWQTFRIKDVSTAVYQAYRKSDLSQDERWHRFLDVLNGRQSTKEEQLSEKWIVFEDEIIERDGLLEFYVVPNFDVDSLFGRPLCNEENEDSYNAYANYDIAADRICDSLEIIVHHEDEETECVEDKWLEYPLGAAEREMLLRKMEEHCLKRTGMSLADYRAQFITEDIAPLVGPVM